MHAYDSASSHATAQGWMAPLLTMRLEPDAGRAGWLLSCCSAGRLLERSSTASALLADDRLLLHSERLRWPCCCDTAASVTA
jgi:hypothetical protein